MGFIQKHIEKQVKNTAKGIGRKIGTEVGKGLENLAKKAFKMPRKKK